MIESAVLHRLPPPPAEPPVMTSLDCLAPKFRARLVIMLSDLRARGFDPIVAESCRSDERQSWLFGMGRDYDDGRGIVTNASTGLYSWHHFGLAVDLTSKAHGDEAPARFWDAIGDACATHGLSWGGAWPRFADRPHVQHGAPMRQSPSSRAAELLATGGLVAVWHAVGAA
jgi:hypothetical protein